MHPTHQVLHEATIAPGTLIDLLFASMIKAQQVAAYAADPPLARHVGNVSTYSDGKGKGKRKRLPFYRVWQLEG